MKQKKNHLIALLVTVIFHAVLLVVLLTVFLRYDSAAEAAREWPPVDSSEILLGGEYVMAGDIPEPGHDSEPAAQAEAEPATAEPQPEAVSQPAPEPVVTAKDPSPAKASESVTPQQRPDAEARKREQEQQAAEQKRKEQSAKINSRVAFGTGSGKSGQPDGNSATGAVSGVAASGLGNRQALSLPQPPRGPMGKVVVSIKVDRSGRVTSATFLSGTGSAGASEEARRQCIAAARKARFSETADGPAQQTGTLTYVYK